MITFCSFHCHNNHLFGKGFPSPPPPPAVYFVLRQLTCTPPLSRSLSLLAVILLSIHFIVRSFTLPSGLYICTGICYCPVHILSYAGPRRVIKSKVNQQHTMREENEEEEFLLPVSKCRMRRADSPCLLGLLCNLAGDFIRSHLHVWLFYALRLSNAQHMATRKRLVANPAIK